MTTLSGTESIDTFLYEVILITPSGKKVPVIAYSMPVLSGPVSQIDIDALARIFPDFQVSRIPDFQVSNFLGSQISRFPGL